MKNLRADRSQGKLAIIRCRIFLSSNLLSKNIKTKIYRTIILPFFFCGCETWSVTMREAIG